MIVSFEALWDSIEDGLEAFPGSPGSLISEDFCGASFPALAKYGHGVSRLDTEGRRGPLPRSTGRWHGGSSFVTCSVALASFAIPSRLLGFPPSN